MKMNSVFKVTAKNKFSDYYKLSVILILTVILYYNYLSEY